MAQQFETKYDIPIGIGLIISLIIGWEYIISNYPMPNGLLLIGSFTCFCLLVAFILVRVLGKKKQSGD